LHVLSKGGFSYSSDYSKKLREIYNSGKYPADITDWDYGIYYPIQGLAMKIVNDAINSSSERFETSISGGAEVETFRYYNKNIPALFGVCFGNNNERNLLITNKSGFSHKISLSENAKKINGQFTMTYISSDDPKVMNTSENRELIKIKSKDVKNDFEIPVYSVVRLEWKIK
jgi:hypothetical protein